MLRETPPVLRLLLILASVVGAGCRGSAAPPDAAAPRCEAVAALPGSVGLPVSVRAAIAASAIPAEARSPARVVCNRLALEAGAFARQHALDPIDWRPWSPEVLAEAKKLGRPLFVMTGFAACGACKDFATAEMRSLPLAQDINGHFVAVLVDREQRPDVDTYLMHATEVLTGSAGWPAAVFLQGDGKPFDAWSWGAAANAKKGERSLAKVVEQVLRHAALSGGTLGEHSESTAEKLQVRADVDMSGPLPDAAAVAESLRSELVSSFDAASGSFGAPPLFPRSPLLEFLLTAPAANDAVDGAGIVTKSLDILAASDLADAVGGGFHRFAKKEAWRDPAWEKMLADNAALASVYLDAAARTKKSEFAATAQGILDFLLRDLRLAGGAFAASLDAVTWDADGNACGGCGYGESDEARRAAKESAAGREKALADRASRPRPDRDDRVLADANALAISALVRGAAVLGDRRYLDAAVAAAVAVDATLRDGGRVLHCAEPDGRRCADGYLSDQTLLALAYLDLDAASAAGGSRWLDAARAIADSVPGRFEHQGSGAFFLNGDDAEALPLRFQPDLDTVSPCGNSAAATLYTRLAARSREKRYADTARRTFEAFSKTLTMRPLMLPSMVSALLDWNRLPASLKGGPAAQP